MKRAVYFLVALAALAGMAWSAEIRTVGEKIDDDIVSIETQGGRTVVKTAKGKSIALSEVKHIRFEEGAARFESDQNVVLVNKDELHGQIGAWLPKGDSFTLKTASLGNVTVKIDSVAAIFFGGRALEQHHRQKNLGWLEDPKFAGRPPNDTVFIHAGGKASGTINEISNAGINLDAQGIGKNVFAIKDVDALVTGNVGGGPPPPPAKGTLVRVRCLDGSSISGVVVKLGEGRLELEHILDKIQISTKEILELFVLNGAFVYVSDLTPTKVDQHFMPAFGYDLDRYTWKKDKENVDCGTLTLGGHTYDKGLGVHTFCALTYAINGAFKEFRATIGLDDVIKYYGLPNQGEVVFRVLLGDEKAGMKIAKELVFKGKDGKVTEGVRMKRGDTPYELAVNVEGVEQITLVADYGSSMHILGRADWADAHFVKR